MNYRGQVVKRLLYRAMVEDKSGNTGGVHTINVKVPTKVSVKETKTDNGKIAVSIFFVYDQPKKASTRGKKAPAKKAPTKKRAHSKKAPVEKAVGSEPTTRPLSAIA